MDKPTQITPPATPAKPSLKITPEFERQLKDAREKRQAERDRTAILHCARKLKFDPE